MYRSGEDVDNGGGSMSVRAEGIWEIFVPSCPFFCEPQTSLKHKIYEIKKHGNFYECLSVFTPRSSTIVLFWCLGLIFIAWSYIHAPYEEADVGLAYGVHS